MSDLGVQLPATHDAVRELGSREDAAALTTLAVAAAVDDQFLRRTALEVIGRHPRGRELSAIVLEAFRDPSEYVVRAACEIAEQWKLLEAHDLVLSHLANASGATRRAAVRALGAIWVDTDFPLTLNIYARDHETGVRREAAWVLRQRATPADWRILFDALYVDELARHRVWACELAASLSGPEILPVLSSLASDPDGHVRKAAARATQAISSRHRSHLAP
jgi:HEAT repeat protein